MNFNLNKILLSIYLIIFLIINVLNYIICDIVSIEFMLIGNHYRKN